MKMNKKRIIAPWAALPGDLLCIILEKLSDLDLACSANVCKDWRDISEGIKRKRVLPCTFYFEKSAADSIRPKLFDPCSNRTYYPQKDGELGMVINFIQSAKLCASKQSWLLFAHKVDFPCETLFLTYSPISNHYLCLPALKIHYYDVATFSKDPSSPDCIFFVAQRRQYDSTIYISTYSIGQGGWCTQVVDVAGDMLRRRRISSVVYGETKGGYGEFRCVYEGGRVATYTTLGLHWSLITRKRCPLKELVQERWQNDRRMQTRKIRHWLFEFEGELVAVFRLRSSVDGTYVYSAAYFDWSDNRWVIKENVGRLAVVFSKPGNYSSCVLLPSFDEAGHCFCKAQSVSPLSDLKVFYASAFNSKQCLVERPYIFHR